MAFKMKGTGAGHGTGSGPSPNKLDPVKKQALKTGAKLVGKRLLGAALGPIGWAWTAMDIAKAGYDYHKKNQEKKNKQQPTKTVDENVEKNTNVVDQPSIERGTTIGAVEAQTAGPSQEVQTTKPSQETKTAPTENVKKKSTVSKPKTSTKSSSGKLTYAQAKKNDPNLSKYIAERKKYKKGSPEYKVVQNKINAAYRVKKRH
tara:strand:- start:918 stop:1526 length:609 start_codon:yes stop_codon:yes gene_type:complete